MVVDDNPDIAHTISAGLELAGFELRWVGDGMQAIALASAFAPDVVLLDIGLLQMEGYQLARRLRRLPQTAQSFLIALTGYGQPEDRRRAQEAGFSEHIVKAADPQAPVQMIEEWLATKVQAGVGPLLSVNDLALTSNETAV